MAYLIKRHFWVLNLLVVATCAVLAGRAATHVVEAAATTPPPLLVARRLPSFTPPPPRDPERIATRNVFCSGCLRTDAPARTTLALELVSTMVCPRDERWSMAVIRTGEGEPRLYDGGRAIASTGATVLKIVNRRVYLHNAGRIEYLDLEPRADRVSSSVDHVRCAGTTCTVDRSLVESALRDPTTLATTVRIFPSRNGGFTLTAIRPGSIFATLGLQDGDTVKSINGLDFSTPSQVLDAYPRLRNATHLSVQLERRGRPTALDYVIR